MSNIKSTTDGLEILYKRYYQNSPARQLELEKMRLDEQVSREIFKLKEVHQLSNQELAKLTNIEEFVIESLENGDYEGNSFLLLNIIANALKMKIKFELVSSGLAN